MKKKHLISLSLMFASALTALTSGNFFAAQSLTLPEGMYRWFVIQAYNTACSLNGGKEGIWDQQLEGSSVSDWITDTALSYGKEYLAAEEKFTEKELEISDSAMETLASTQERYWNELGYGRYYADYGITEEEFHNVLLHSLKTDLLYSQEEAGLIAAVTDGQIEAYVSQHGILFEYVAVPYPDATDSQEGSTETGSEGTDSLVDFESLYQSYQNRLVQRETLADLAREVYEDSSLQNLGVSSSCSSYSPAALYFDSNTSLTGKFWEALEQAGYGETVSFDDEGSQFWVIFQKQEFSMDWPGIDLYRASIKSQIASDTFAEEMLSWADDVELENEKELKKGTDPEDLLRRK